MTVARYLAVPPMTEIPAQPRLLTTADDAPLSGGPLATEGRRDVRTLFEAERTGLFRFLWRLAGNTSDAEDLLQETFLTAWKKKDKFEGRDSASAYLRRTAFHLFLNSRRRDRRRVGAPREEDRILECVSETVAEDEARANLRARVRAAVDALPDGTREVFVLFRFDGLSCAQIAELCNLSLSAVEGRIERATKLVATRLRPHREDLPEV